MTDRADDATDGAADDVPAGATDGADDVPDGAADDAPVSAPDRPSATD
ncbi:hypothetical protein [Streptomyces roseicoloratus]|nr:hypothetical protein [Streptomyces roseicoloratus]